jgi:hypothetical protein
MRRVVLAMAIMLAGCGEVEPEPQESAAAPTSYFIRKVDLYRTTPNDICRAQDGEFLANLMGRIGKLLPADYGGLATIEDFNVGSAFDGKGQSAVLRFHASKAGEPDVMMSAVGKFDPKGCNVGPITVRQGPAGDYPAAKLIASEQGA